MSKKMMDGMHEGKAHMMGRGDMQGDMSPTVTDYQKPMKAYSQEGFTKTLDYIDRQDAFQSKMATDIEKQAYHGRYS